MKSPSTKLHRWSRSIHRELSFFLSGMVLIYAISGLFMNHRDKINPHYSVTRSEYRIDQLPQQSQIDRAAVETLLAELDIEESYTKHYFPETGTMKVFLQGGSSLQVDLNTGAAVYESLRRRPLLSTLTTLHYNPGKWWTWFSDLFAIGLIVIVITGIAMLGGRKGLVGRGGIELAAGIAIPLLLLLLS